MAETVGLEAKLDLKQFDSNLKKYMSGVAQMGDTTAKVAGSMVRSFAEIGKGLAVFSGGVIAGAAAGIGVIGVAAWDVSSEVHKASGQMAASLGILPEEAAKFADVAKEVYGNNFAASMEDAAAAVTDVAKTLEMAADDPSLQGITEKAIAMRDVFGVEVPESVSAVKTLMDNFGISAERAFDLVATGFQSGLDRSGDFLDTIGEYSVQFSNGGASAEEFFGLLDSGLQGGMLGTDKAADAFKEFRLRIQDGSQLTADSLAAIGLSAEQITTGMANGTMTAADAWDMVIRALQTTEDPVKRFNAGVGLIGSQFEDLGDKATIALDLTADWAEGSEGAADRLNAKYNTLGDVWEGIRRKFVLAFTPITDKLLDLANSVAPLINEKLGGIGAAIGQFLDIVFGKVDDSKSTWDALRGQLNTVFGEEMGQKIGNVALAIASFFSALRDDEDVMGAFKGALERVWGEEGANFAQKVEDVWKKIGDLKTGIQDLLTEVGKITGPFEGAITDFVEWKDVAAALAIVITATLIPAIWALIASAGPIGLAFGALALAIAGIRYAWETNFANFRTNVEGYIELFGQIGQGLSTFIEGSKRQWAELTAEWDIVKNALLGFGTAVSIIFQEIGQEFKPVGDALTRFKDGAIEALQNLARSAENVEAAIDNVFVNIAIAVGNLGDAWDAGLAGIRTAMQNFQTVIDNAFVNLAIGIGGLRDAWDAGLEEVEQRTEAATRYIDDTFSPLADSIKQNLGGALQEVVAFATGNETEFQHVNAIWTEAKETGTTLFTDLVGVIQANTPAWAQELGKWTVEVGVAVGNWVNELLGGADWIGVGADIVGFVQQGAESIYELVTGSFGSLVSTLTSALSDPATSWFTLASQALTRVQEGFESMRSSLVERMRQIVQRLVDQFSFDTWKEIGVNIIEGIKSGLDAAVQGLIDKITGIADLLPNWVQQALGIQSPSKVFYEIGKNIMLGWIGGIESQSSRLLGTMKSLINGLGDQVQNAGLGAGQILTGAASTFLGLGNAPLEQLEAWMEQHQEFYQTVMRNRSNWDASGFLGMFEAASSQSIRFKEAQRIQSSYKQVLDLITAVRESGADVQATFRDSLNYFRHWDTIAPVDQLKIVNDSVEAINRTLKQTILASVKGFDTLVAKARQSRLSVEDVENEFAVNRRTRLEIFQASIAQLDANILEAENRLLSVGDESQFAILQTLEAGRNQQIYELREFLGQIEELDKKVRRVPILNGDLGQAQAEAFRKTMIDPLEDVIRGGFTDAFTRGKWLELYENRIVQLAFFKEDMEALAAVMRDVGDITGGSRFAALFQESRLDGLLGRLQDVNLTSAQRNTLIQEYNREQQKLLSLQEKQQQLGFLEEQKSLLDSVVSLAGETGQLANIANIFQGIQLGPNANLDDMLTATNRLMTERLRLTEEYLAQQEKILANAQKQQQLDFLNQQLDVLEKVRALEEDYDPLVDRGKIFAGINFGAGMTLDNMLTLLGRVLDTEMAITNYRLAGGEPFDDSAAGATRGAAVPYTLADRGVVIQFNGPTHINNGMDLAMFGQFVRQEINKVLN